MSTMTENQWQIAHAIARQIVKDGGKAGELKKAIAYLRTCADASDGGARFFKYLGNLVGGGNKIGHSKLTVDYYRSLNQACVQYLGPLQDRPQVMLEILGWAGRLIAYYQASPIAELTGAPLTVTVESERQSAVKAAAQAARFEVGQVIEVQVDKIEGNKVTYELPGGIRLTQKEPKKASSLKVGQSVMTEITELKDTGVPKKLKLE